MRRRHPRIPAPEGSYGCTACGEIKPVAAFHKRPDGKPTSWCKPCKAAKKRALESVVREHDETAVERFWAKVEKTETCWIWTGANRHGHGHFFYKGKMRRAHRVSLELAGMPVPEDMHVDHVCRNRACIRPDHLRAVTPRQNALENNESPLAKNAGRAACIHGHPYTPETMVYYTAPYRIDAHGKKKPGTPVRQCLICRRESGRRAYEKHKAKLLSGCFDKK